MRVTNLHEKLVPEGEPINPIKAICKSFNSRLSEILGEGNHSPLQLGKPSKCLLECGIPDLPIEISLQKLRSKKSQKNHQFPVHSVIDMPAHIFSPIAVFSSASLKEESKDNFVVLTEMEHNGINMVAIIQPGKFKLNGDVNDIRSVYPKDSISEVFNWVISKKVLYVDKKKFLDWLGKHQSISDEVTQLIEDCTKVLQSL